jgi:hypothetical protein
LLGVGIDWAEQFHLVALGRPGEGVIEITQVPHSPAAVDALLAKITALEPDPAEVRVAIETRHGLLVERLTDAGVAVLPVNPDLVARRRGPARKKDDTDDARILCLLALDRFAALRPLVPMVRWPASFARSPATMNAPPATSAGCSTDCAKTCWPPSRPRCRSPPTTWPPPPRCGCCNAGPPATTWPPPPALTWSPSPKPPITAGPNDSLTRSPRR